MLFGDEVYLFVVHRAPGEPAPASERIVLHESGGFYLTNALVEARIPGSFQILLVAQRPLEPFLLEAGASVLEHRLDECPRDETIPPRVRVHVLHEKV